MPVPGSNDPVDESMLDDREWDEVVPDEAEPTPVQESDSPQDDPQPVNKSGFGSYDPKELRPEVTPERLAPESLDETTGEPQASFDDRYKDPFVGLLYLGALTSTFTWLGHRITVRTLSSDDTLAIARLVKPWADTIGVERAYVIAMAGMAVVEIDGRSLPTPIGESQDTYVWAQQRFDYAKANWFAPTVDKIYGEYLLLEEKAAEVIAEMEKASDPAGSSPGSSDTSAAPSDGAF